MRTENFVLLEAKDTVKFVSGSLADLEPPVTVTLLMPLFCTSDRISSTVISVYSALGTFAHFVYDRLSRMGYSVRSVTVYETPNNSATYID